MPDLRNVPVILHRTVATKNSIPTYQGNTAVRIMLLNPDFRRHAGIREAARQRGEVQLRVLDPAFQLILVSDIVW